MHIITNVWNTLKTAVWISFALIYAAIHCTTTCGREEELVW